MVLPGDKEEMRGFQDYCVNNTKLLVDITLPIVTAFLPSRSLFEVLYNRSVESNSCVGHNKLTLEPLGQHLYLSLPRRYRYCFRDKEYVSLVIVREAN